MRTLGKIRLARETRRRHCSSACSSGHFVAHAHNEIYLWPTGPAITFLVATNLHSHCIIYLLKIEERSIKIIS